MRQPSVPCIYEHKHVSNRVVRAAAMDLSQLMAISVVVILSLAYNSTHPHTYTHTHTQTHGCLQYTLRPKDMHL